MQLQTTRLRFELVLFAHALEDTFTTEPKQSDNKMIEKNDPRLTAFVLGELDESEKLEIEAAIESSAEVRNFVAEIRSTSSFVEEAFAQELSGSSEDLVLKSSVGVGSTESIKKKNDQWTTWAAAVSISVLGLSIVYLMTPGSGHRNFKAIELSGGLETQRDLELSKLEDQVAETTDGASEFVPNLSLIVPQNENEIDGFDVQSPDELEMGKGFASREQSDPFNANSMDVFGDDGNEILNPDVELTQENVNSEREFDSQDQLVQSASMAKANMSSVDDSGKLTKNTGNPVLDGLSLEEDGRKISSDGEVPLEVANDQERQKLLERMQEIQSRKEDAFFERLLDVDEDVIDSKEGTAVEFLSGGEIPIEVARDPSKLQEYLARTKSESNLQSGRTRRQTKEAELRASFSDEDERIYRAFLGNLEQEAQADVTIVPGTNTITLTAGQQMVDKVREYLSELNEEDLNRLREDAVGEFESRLKTVLTGDNVNQSAATKLLEISRLLNESENSESRNAEIERAFRAAIEGGSRRESNLERQEIAQQEVQLITQMMRANFDLDNQIAESEKRYQNALKRRSRNHPLVKSSKAQLEMLRQYKNDTSKKFDIVEQRLAAAEEKGVPKETVAKLRKLITRQRLESRPKSWRKVEATGNASRLIVGNKDELDLNGMQVHVQVDGFRARVLIDYFYYNDRDRQLEGNFKIRLPDDASLYYFAFGQSAYDFSPDDGLAQGEFTGGSDQYVSLHPSEIGLARKDAWKNVKESRMVPREKAAFAYSQTVRRRVDPALVEWSGAGIFNARVFPLFPRKLHRIVIGYDVNLTSMSDGLAYHLELPEQTGECRVDLNVSDFAEGKWEMDLDRLVDGSQPKTTSWKSDQTSEHVRSQKRMRFDSPSWRSLTLKAKHDSSIVLQTPKREKGQFFATQLKVDVEANAQSKNDSAVFLVDTSLSSRPEKFNVWLSLMEATLENNRGDLKRFAVMFFDVECRFWKTQWTENTEDNVKALLTDSYQIGLEGATNLHGAILELQDADWIKEGDSQPDVFLLSDGAANWGETNLRFIQNDFASLEFGSLFAYQTGLSGTAIANLRSIAGSTGGAVFSVASEDEVKSASTAHRNKPWKLKSVTADGAKDLMTAGRAEWIYPGQLVTIVGRGLIKDGLKIELSQGNQSKTINVDELVSVESELAGRLYGHVSVGQLESLGESVFDVSAAYARHFRITGSTCSLLMLESEADYRRFDIKPQEDWFVVQSKNASDIVNNTLDNMAKSLADPKTQLKTWISRLEDMSGIGFKMPTALKLAMDQMSINAIDSRLEIGREDRDDWSKKYVQNLSKNSLDADVIGEEMERRRAGSVDAALRAYSNLIESNPGNWVAARDVAFTAMDLDRPAAAYHLLRRVIQNRPFEGSSYAALGQCLDQLNEADLAMIFYELAIGATFQNQGPDFRKIVATHYCSLLNRIIRGDLKSSAKDYAVARSESLNRVFSLEDKDVVISMMWNTDQTDVDLHIVEPSGEECYYQHRTTAAGGKITRDKTDGFGPEMYSVTSAPSGEYKVLVKYFGSNQNRTKVTNKVYLTIYENFGSENERKTREMITLSKVGSKEQIKTMKWPNK